MSNIPNQTTPTNSINPQVGLPSFMTAPKTFKLQTEQAFAGISVPWINLLLSWILIAIIPIASTIFIRNLAYQTIIGIFVAMWFGFFFRYFTTYDDYIKNRLKIKFIIDEWYKLHDLSKCSTDLNRLLTFIPIVAVHENGIIEFVGNRFAVLYSYFAPDVEENETALQMHVDEIKGLLHLFTGDMLFRFIMCSRHAYVSPILKKLQERMSKSKLPPNMFRLLKSLYDTIKNKKNKAPDVDFYLFIAFGEEVDTLDKALHTVKTELPKIEQGLDEARMRARRLENRNKIIIEYMNFFRPLGVMKNVII